MADETIDTTPAAGSGGLDAPIDAGVDDSAADAFLDDRFTPEGGWDDESGLQGLDGGEEDGGGEEDWTAGLPDEVREKIAGKYQSPADVARALVEAQSLTGRQGDELGRMRDQLAEIAARLESNGQQQQPVQQQQQTPTMDQVAQWANQDIASAIDNGELDVGRGIAAVVSAMAGVHQQQMKDLLAQIDERIGERTAPLEDEAYLTNMGREITAIRQRLGNDRYRQFAQPAADLLAQWEATQPGFVRDARSVRAAFDRVLADALLQERREAGAGVLTRSGRGGSRRAPSPSEMILAEMDAAGGAGGNGGL